MREGWYSNDYWALCEDQKEAEHLTAIYGLGESLPGFFIVGLKGWDDFILVDRESQYFSVPTVPLERASLTAFRFPTETLRLQSDERFTEKIKWYLKPIRFGGDPNANENMVWLSLDEHASAVKWWNKLYRDTFVKQRKV